MRTFFVTTVIDEHLQLIIFPGEYRECWEWIHNWQTREPKTRQNFNNFDMRCSSQVSTISHEISKFIGLKNWILVGKNSKWLNIVGPPRHGLCHIICLYCSAITVRFTGVLIHHPSQWWNQKSTSRGTFKIMKEM